MGHVQIDQTYNVRNPASDAIIGSCPESTNEDLSDAIQAASNAFPTWRALSGRQRGRILRKVFDLLVENKADIGRIITAENGNARADAEGEVLLAASFFEWFSEEAARLYGDVIPTQCNQPDPCDQGTSRGMWIDRPMELHACNGSPESGCSPC